MGGTQSLGVCTPTLPSTGQTTVMLTLAASMPAPLGQNPPRRHRRREVVQGLRLRAGADRARARSHVNENAEKGGQPQTHQEEEKAPPTRVFRFE